MSDEKDPVREQIERDARKYEYNGSSYHGYRDGAKAQDPIAWNRCLDEVITMISIRQDGTYGDSEYSELERLKQELEKKRK